MISLGPLALLNPGVTYQMGSVTTTSITGSASDVLNISTTTFSIASGKTLTIWVNVYGSGTLIKTGDGTLLLGNANYYSGGTTISAGTLQLGDASALGSGSVTLAGGTLDINGRSVSKDLILTADSTIINSNVGASLDGNVYLGSATLHLNPNVATNVTINGTVSGNGGLSCADNGKVYLNSANNYTGGTTLADLAYVKLYVGNNDALGNGSLYVGQNSEINLQSYSITVTSLAGRGFITGTTGTLTIDTSTTDTFAGYISGGIGVTKSGAGTLILGNGLALNTYNGDTTITEGALVAGMNTAFGGSTVIVGNGTLDLAGCVIANAVVTSSGATSARLTGSFTLNSDAEVYAASGTTNLDGAITLNGDTNLNAASGATITVKGAVSGAGSVDITGAGTVNLNAANNYSGGTTLSAGTLRLGNNSALGTNSLTIAGATLDINGCTIATSIALTGDGCIANNNSTQAGTLNSNVNTGVSTLGLSTGSGCTLNVGGTISGSGSVDCRGSGTTVLSSANNYTGGTTVSGGALQVGNTLAFSTGTVTVGNATLQLGGYTISNAVVTSAGATSATIANSTGNAVLGGTLTLNADVTLNAASGATLTLSNTISGSGSVTKTGAGTVVLNGTNTYTGDTNISAGTLQLGSNSAIVAGNINLGNATLDLAGHTAYAVVVVNNSNATITNSTGNATLPYYLDLYADVTLNAAAGVTLTINSSVDENYHTITKTGDGTVILSGNHYLDGGVVVNAGTLQVGDGGTTTRLDCGIANNAAVVFNTSAAGQIYIGAISGAGSVTKTGSGTLVLNAASSGYSGAMAVMAGTLQAGNNSAFGTGSVTVGNATLDLGGYSVSTAVLTSSGSTSATIANSTGNGTLSGTLALNADATLNAASGATLTLTSTISGTGYGISKAGAGTVILNGTNTYTAGTTVSAGTLRAGNDNALGTAGGTLDLYGHSVSVVSLTGAGTITTTNGASTLTVNNASDCTFSGSITDSTTLTKTGSATFVLAGNQTYTGTTTVSAGTLQIGDGSTATSVVSNITDNAAVVFSTSSAGQTYSGTISGNGTLAKTGSGTLVLTGSQTYSGTTTVSGGMLQLGDGTTNGSLASASIVDNAALVFNVASGTSQTYSGAISGTGSLTKSGSGMLILTGTSGLSGATTVTTGELKLNGNLAASAVTVSLAGTLSGNGTVGSLALAGTVSPGNSIGTIMVAGNYVQASGSTYTVEVNNFGQSDLIHANGTATINGGTLAVVAASGIYNPSTTYTILTANGGVTAGSHYDDITMNLPFLSASLQYNPYTIDLILTRNATTFASVANTRNQRATATYLDTVSTTATGDLATVLYSVLSGQTAPDARAAFDATSGEPYADLTAINFEAANMFTDAAFNHLWNDEFRRPDGSRLWADGVGQWQRQRTSHSYSGYDAPFSGFLVGYDHQADGMLLGLASGYGRSDIDFLGSPAAADVQVFNASLYGRLDFDAVYLATVIGYCHGWNDVSRTIAISGMSTRHASASVDDNLLGLLLQTGYRLDRGSWTLTPLVGMRYLGGSLAGATEHGADSLDLVVSGASRSSISSHLGARLGYRVTPKWRWEGYSQWEHEYSDTFGNVTMTFSGDTSTFYTVQGVACERDGMRSGLSTVGQLNDHLEFRLNYDTMLRATSTSQQLTGGLSMAF